MPAYLKGWRVFGNNVLVSLWGVKVTIRKNVKEYFISHPSRLAAEGGRAVSAG